MIDFDAPIDSLERAEPFFKAKGCHNHHMWHDETERYLEFLRLEIPSSLKLQWVIEEFDRYVSVVHRYAANEYKGDNELWWVHSRLTDLYYIIVYYHGRSDDFSSYYFVILVELTDSIAKFVKGRDRIIVSETILGKSRDRSDGIIKEAFRLGNRDARRRASGIVDSLLEYDEPDQAQNLRRLEDIKIHNKLRSPLRIRLGMLRLWFEDRLWDFRYWFKEI